MTDRGNFFVMDRRTLEDICDRSDGLDTAAAYLVLVRPLKVMAAAPQAISSAYQRGVPKRAARSYRQS